MPPSAEEVKWLLGPVRQGGYVVFRKLKSSTEHPASLTAPGKALGLLRALCTLYSIVLLDK